MNLYRLLPLLFLALNFSGTPKVGNTRPRDGMTAAITAPIIREENEEFIPWVGDRRLSWEDFYSEPHTGTDAVASTSTTLGVSYQIVDTTLSYHITCNFSKVKSWGLLKTNYILAHEQGHFDITEVFARKLHKALQEYHFNPDTYKEDISAIYQSIVKEKEDMQEAYDGESDHSRQRKVQYEWLQKISDLMQETEPYAAYP